MSSNKKIKLSVLEGIVREIVKTLAKEMSGTAAASPVTGPNFLKKKVYEKAEPDDTELAVDTTRKSNCCCAPPDREVAKDNSGRCSKCKDGAMFSGGKKKVKENEFDGKKMPKHNAKISDAEMEEAKDVAAKIWQPVYLTQFHSISASGGKHFVVYLHSFTGDRHYMYKAKNGKWFYSRGFGVDSKFVPADEYLNEMTTTGAVSGFNVPGCFSRKGGSKKGIEGSAALGYELTPMGKKEMQRSADKIYENQAALGTKFSRAQQSHDTQSEPEPDSKRERNCKTDGHDFTIKAHRDPKTGKLTTYKKCDHCGVTTNPKTK